MVGVCEITPRYQDYRSSKVNTVTFNRLLVEAVRECVNQYKVSFLPLHLHFLTQDGEFIAHLYQYFNRESEFTLAGGLVVREVLFKEIQLIPMDGNH